MTSRIALVTGGNKGIGLAICKGLAQVPNVHVILGSRDAAKGKEAVKQLNDGGLKNVELSEIDVSSFDSIEKAVKQILEKHKKIDILINNAGVAPGWGVSFLETKIEDINNTFQINTLGPLRLCQLLVPVMRDNKYGRIVNVSSGAGQISDMNGKDVPYRFSKVSLNALTRIISDELKNENIIVNSMCPGSIKTDMNPWAKRTVDEPVETAVYLATLPDDGPRNLFWRDKKQMPW